MTVPGELSGLHGATCNCGAELELQVCESAAGHYLGYWCDRCGPWSRETGYYKDKYVAAAQLERARVGRVPWKVRRG
jgi:hypothetical protein